MNTLETSKKSLNVDCYLKSLHFHYDCVVAFADQLPQVSVLFHNYGLGQLQDADSGSGVVANVVNLDMDSLKQK